MTLSVPEQICEDLVLFSGFGAAAILAAVYREPRAL